MAPPHRQPPETGRHHAGERELIVRLAEIFGPPPAGVICGIGDDAAGLAPEAGYTLLWTIDSLIEGVHFDLRYTPLRLLGRKALAVNLSDVAAMGGEPQYALLSLGWPPERSLTLALELAQGMQELAGECGVAVIGGDTVAAPEGLTLSLTVLGRVKPQELLRRDQARVGDMIYVTGPLGQAAAGLEMLRHGLELPETLQQPLRQAFLDPRPELVAGRLLAEHHLASSLIDLSDGLASDLYQICRLSRVGAVVEAASVPVPPAVRQVAEMIGKNPLDLALQGGEDYLLLFTTPPEKQSHLHQCFARAGLAKPCCLGNIVSGTAVTLRTATAEIDISGQGFDHFSGKSL